MHVTCHTNSPELSELMGINAVNTILYPQTTVDHAHHQSTTAK